MPADFDFVFEQIARDGVAYPLGAQLLESNDITRLLAACLPDLGDGTTPSIRDCLKTVWERRLDG